MIKEPIQMKCQVIHSENNNKYILKCQLIVQETTMKAAAAQLIYTC